MFGHLCWAARERFGVGKLSALLEGYVDGRPWAVVSDAFPAGHLPKPALPDVLIGLEGDPSQRKARRASAWIPAEGWAGPLSDWLAQAAVAPAAEPAIFTQSTINRLTGTTGKGQFAPRRVERLVHQRGMHYDLYCAFDETRTGEDGLLQLLEDIGTAGFGRDATAGLGKFELCGTSEVPWTATPARHFMTLAPCAPDPEVLEPRACFYKPLTRFGRHGNLAAVQGNPYKRPVLFCRTGAALTLKEAGPALVTGRGLGGEAAPLSSSIPATVHQGYAPVVPLNAEWSA